MFNNLGATLQVEVLVREGDHAITIEDATTDEIPAATQTLWLATGTGRLNVDLSQGVREILARGRTRLTVRLTTLDENVRLNFRVPSIGSDLYSGGATALQLTPSQRGVADVYDSEGVLLAGGRSIVDIRNFTAGSYFVRIFDPAVTGETEAVDLPFFVEVQAPAAGRTHLAYYDPDRDVIFGGDGNDLIIGNQDKDRLFGETGSDTFIADAMEVRDLAGSVEVLSAPATVERGPSNPGTIDPVVVLPDPGLREAVANQLGVQTTTAWNGVPIPVESILASHLAEMTHLDAFNLDIHDLTGIEFSVNLARLNLLDNEVADLSPLEALAGTLAGLSRLQYLALGFNPIADLAPLTVDDCD